MSVTFDCWLSLKLFCDIKFGYDGHHDWSFKREYLPVRSEENMPLASFRVGGDTPETEGGTVSRIDI